jgi:CO/xanthine dehydrogenase FAD-binding subunit
MRAHLPSYDLIAPKTFDEALALIDQGHKPLAGGTDLMVLFEAGRLPRASYVSLWNLEPLRGIKIEKDYVTLGALTTYAQIRREKTIQTEFPNLVSAAKETGAIAIQNRGTIGGNIANSSPAADSPPALLTYDAEIELTSLNGRRWVPYQEFHTGYKTMLMKPNEIITKIRVPRFQGTRIHHYRKVGTRKAQAITKVGLASTFQIENKKVIHARIAFSSVAPIPLRCLATEKVLQDQTLSQAVIQKAKVALAGEIKPIGDIRSTEEYRRTVALNLFESYLSDILTGE